MKRAAVVSAGYRSRWEKGLSNRITESNGDCCVTERVLQLPPTLILLPSLSSAGRFLRACLKTPTRALPLLGLLLTPSLFGQTTYHLNAYSRNGDTLATNSILEKAGVTRTPAGTAVSGDGLITSHPAGASIKVTAPTSLRLGLPLSFHGWAPTAYDAVTGYAAADTTNPLTFPLTADRKLVAFSGFPFADVLTTRARVDDRRPRALDRHL